MYKYRGTFYLICQLKFDMNNNRVKNINLNII